MNRWIVRVGPTLNTNNYIENLLEWSNRDDLEKDASFISQLADITLGHFFSYNPPPGGFFRRFYNFDPVGTDYEVKLAHHLASGLMDPDDYVYRGFVAECLCHWAFNAFWASDAVSDPRPSSRTAGYDLLRFYFDRSLSRLDWIQAKGTPRRVAANCSRAIKKFAQMDEGVYDHELAAEINRLLSPLVRTGRLSISQVKEMYWEKERHQYTVFVVHDVGERRLKVLRTYARRVSGSPYRRHACFLEVSDWEALMRELAREIEERFS